MLNTFLNLSLAIWRDGSFWLAIVPRFVTHRTYEYQELFLRHWSDSSRVILTTRDQLNDWSIDLRCIAASYLFHGNHPDTRRRYSSKDKLNRMLTTANSQIKALELIDVRTAWYNHHSEYTFHSQKSGYLITERQKLLKMEVCLGFPFFFWLYYS